MYVYVCMNCYIYVSFLLSDCLSFIYISTFLVCLYIYLHISFSFQVTGPLCFSAFENRPYCIFNFYSLTFVWKDYKTSQQLICAAYHLCLKQALGQAIQVCFLVRLFFSHGDGNIVCGPYCSASSLSGTGTWRNCWQSVKPFGHFTGGCLSPHWWHTFTSVLSNMSEEEEGLSILAKNMLELSPGLFLLQLLSRAWLSARAFKH